MSEYLEARIEALRIAERLEGSVAFKIKCAEKFYEFLEQGITPPTRFNDGYIYMHPPYITYTDGGSVTTNNTPESKL